MYWYVFWGVVPVGEPACLWKRKNAKLCIELATLSQLLLK